MQLEFTTTEVILDTVDLPLAGPSELEIAVVDGQAYLLVAGEAEGGLTAFAIPQDAPLALADVVWAGPTSGTLGLRDLAVVEGAAGPLVYTAAMADDNQVAYQIDADGQLQTAQVLGGDPALYAKWNLVEAVAAGGKTYLYYTVWGKSGFDRVEVAADGTLSGRMHVADTAALFLGDVTAIHGASLGGQDYVFVSGGLDAGVHGYRMAADGSLEMVATLSPENGGLSGIGAMASASVSGQDYLLVAAGGTDQLLVYALAQDGSLALRHAEIDTGETRFADASTLQVAEIAGRTLVFAAGSDDGFSVFELTASGGLVNWANIADGFDVTLGNVSDIAVLATATGAKVFVASASEHGVTRFDLVLANSLAEVRGTAAADVLVGGTADDSLYGEDGGDFLFGGTGYDFITDGPGSDHLWGGAGADRFVLISDRRIDTIHDFEIGVDKLDFSNFPGTYSTAALEITATDSGARIIVGDDILLVQSLDGASLLPDDFVASDFIF